MPETIRKMVPTMARANSAQRQTQPKVMLWHFLTSPSITSSFSWI